MERLEGMYSPVDKYDGIIVEALAELKGGASVQEVTEKVFEKSRNFLTIDDVTRVTSNGEVAWRNRMRWSKSRLTKAGLVVSSRRGYWTLTDKALSALTTLKGRRK